VADDGGFSLPEPSGLSNRRMPLKIVLAFETMMAEQTAHSLVNLHEAIFGCEPDYDLPLEDVTAACVGAMAAYQDPAEGH
jgi:hypothetical protein